jgi:ubiquinone/menaquinone biosynthesis C-methylase UbiE
MNSNSDERSENEKYKNFINAQLKEDENLFCALRKEKQLDYLFPKLERDLREGGINQLLDLCCGYGRLVYFLNEKFPQLRIHGIDYMETMVEKGKNQFKDRLHISFEAKNAFDLSQFYDKSFDVTVIHKTISWLPYYESILTEAIKVSRKKIYITSLFWEGDIDFITKIFKNASAGDFDNFSYINTYSLPKFRSFCFEMGVKNVLVENMYIDVDLEKNLESDKLQTYTAKTKDDFRLEFTGPIQLNWKLIEIVL